MIARCNPRRNALNAWPTAGRHPVRAVGRRIHPHRSGDGRERTNRAWPDWGKPLFVQISDTHIGFNKKRIPTSTGRLHKPSTSLNGMAEQPALNHPHGRYHAPVQAGRIRSRPADVLSLTHDGDAYGAGRTRHDRPHGGRNTSIDSAKPPAIVGYYSFDHGGVHFIRADQRIAVQAGAASARWARIKSPG